MDELKFQYIMNYKAYRRIMIARNILITLLLAGGAACFVMLNIVLGILMPITVAFIGAISILVSLHKEETYMVFADRVVIKSGQQRKSVPIENIKSVRYRRAFYEKDLATGTVRIRAIKQGGKTVGTFKLKHIFDAKPLMEYLTDRIKSA